MIRLKLLNKIAHYSTKTSKNVQQLHSFGKYAYYDSISEIAHLNMVRSDAYYIARQRQQLAVKNKAEDDIKRHGNIEKEPIIEKKDNTLVFDTRSKDVKPRFSEVFGGSTKTALKSSRRDVSYRNKHRKIAGVDVPARPIEPDNCCMSGCINCVWELFNEDLEEWKQKRIEAAHSLLKQKTQGGLGKNGEIERWPSDWEFPPKILDKDLIHPDLKLKLKSKKDEKDVEDIQGMPVGLQVFANFEKKKKEKKINTNRTKQRTPVELFDSKSTTEATNV
jgi:hypothetical protein